MNPARMALLEELARFGVENDAQHTERREQMLNVTPETGAFLAILVRATKAGRVLEVGTSNGYSTLWLADAVESLGRASRAQVLTFEANPVKAERARANFERAGLSALIEIQVREAGEGLRRLADASFGLVFLDADRSRYAAWWPEVRRVLAPGGLLVIDNAVSHAAELEELATLVAAEPGFCSVLVPIGKGELLAHKT